MSTRPLLLALLLVSGAIASAATINLTSGQSVQTAINSASTGDVIVLAMGTYYGDLNFMGKAITVRSLNPNHPGYQNETLIIGSGNGSVVTFNHGETTASVLTGVSVMSGNAERGGGIYIDAASPTITKCRLTSNAATDQGGGIFVFNQCAPVITRNVIAHNTAGLGGGLMVFLVGYASPAVAGSKAVAPLIAYNTFSHNTANSGGGICVYASPSTIKNNLIYSNNAAAGGGGGIMSYASATQIVNNTIAYNDCTPLQQLAGGGIAIIGGNPKISNCIIAFNTYVGLMLPEEGWSNLSYCDLYGNSVADVMHLPNAIGTNGNFSSNPQFVDPASGKYYLKSLMGHWDDFLKTWVNDTVTSPCLDAGDPAASCAAEPLPNGGRLNLGAYGNMSIASKSSYLYSHVPNDGGSFARAGTLTITFKEAMNHASAQSHFSLVPAGGTALTGTFSWDGKKMMFKPTAPLVKNKSFTVTLAEGISRAAGGVTQWSELFSFTTGHEPVVISKYPTGHSVARNSQIRVTFDQAMIKNSVNTNFKVSPATLGTVTWSGNQMRFTPTALLAPGTDYTVTVGKNTRSAEGLTLGVDCRWTFHTASTLSTLPRMTATAQSTAAGVQIAVRLSAAAEVGVTVVNVAGRTVAMLEPRELPEGSSTLLWNGRSAAGSVVPAGQYLVRLQARTEEGARAEALAAVRR